MTQEQELIGRETLIIDVVRALREPEYRAELCRELEGGVTDTVMLEAADMIEALRAQLEKARKVKPLEWADFVNESISTCGTYRISPLNDGVIGRKTYRLVRASFGTQYLGDFRDNTDPQNAIDAAKAAAQADYQRRYNAMSQEGE